MSGQGVGYPSLKLRKTEHGSEQPVLTRTSLGKWALGVPSNQCHTKRMVIENKKDVMGGILEL